MTFDRRPGPGRIIASLLLTAGLFAYFLHRAPLAEVVDALRRVHLGWLAAAVATALLSYTLRALRWGIILRPAGTARARHLLGATAAGFAASTVLPARAGEIVRPLLLSAQSKLPAAATLASILTERIIDLASVLGLFAVGVVLARDRLLPQALPMLGRAAVLAAVGLAVGIALLALLLRNPTGAAERLSARLPARFRSRGKGFITHLIEGLIVVRDPRKLAAIAVASLLVWIPACWQIQMMARGFDLHLGLATTFVVLAVSVLGLAVPTPGGVGGFHAAIQFALTALLGIDIGTATAFALVHHAVCFFPITAIGLGYLAASGAAWRRADPGAGATTTGEA